MLFLILLVTASLIKKNIEQEKMLEDFRALNVDETKLAEFRKFEKAIEQLKANNGEFVDMELEEIINELVLAREKYSELKDKDSQIAKLVEKLKEFEKNQEELAYYKEKYGNDKPPCWKKEGTIATVEYLYDATINDVGVVCPTRTRNIVFTLDIDQDPGRPTIIIKIVIDAFPDVLLL